MRVVIIGGNAAGMSAAAKLKRMQKDCEVIVFEELDYISFGACGLPYYVGGYFDQKERMLVRTKEQAQAMGIDVRLCHKAVEVNDIKRSVSVQSLREGTKECISFDKLLIASGASAVTPPIKNYNLGNVYHLKSLRDGIVIKEKLQQDSIKRIAIIGAGFIGLEMADVARHLKKEVHLFQISDRILNGVFDQEITKILEEELNKDGVHLHLNTAVEEFEGMEQVEKVIASGKEYEVDLVVVATGVRPNTSFLESTAIERLENGAVIIDESGQTSVEGIYAAGDCATVPHLLKDTPAYIPLATTANKLGRIVGENLAGGDKRFMKTLGSSCLKLLSMEAGRTGLSEKEAIELGLDTKSVVIKDKNHTDYYDGQEDIWIKLIYNAKTKVILGAQAVGKSDAVMRTNVLAAAITAKMTTEQLGMLDLCYAPPFSRTWDAINIAGNAAK